MKSTNHQLTQSDTEAIHALFHQVGEKMALFPERKKKVLGEATIREEFIRQGLKFLTPGISQLKSHLENTELCKST